MIISRTPFRMSFVGGGTDLPSFYEKEYGAVVGTTINKYVYITVNKLSPFYKYKYRLGYSQTELASNADEIKHNIIRETVKYLNIENIEIVSIADIPAGTGMGSSSSFTVGLLHALHAYKSEFADASTLAKEATKIEMEILKEPIGKQDQYFASYGGFKYMEFHPDGNVKVRPVIMIPEVKERLENNIICFYTGDQRSASKILKDQKDRTENKIEILKKMRDLVKNFVKVLEEGKKLYEVGELLHENWQLKKQLSPYISNPQIDEMYEKALKNGAIGGKIMGAGGGGFLMLYVEEQHHNRIREAFKDYIEMHFGFSSDGSSIIYYTG